jgi:hypothetical protein
MTRAFLLDAVSLQGIHVPADFKTEMIKVAKQIFSSLGWTMKRRVIMVVLRRPSVVPALLNLRGFVKKTSRSTRGQVF